LEKLLDWRPLFSANSFGNVKLPPFHAARVEYLNLLSQGFYEGQVICASDPPDMLERSRGLHIISSLGVCREISEIPGQAERFGMCSELSGACQICPEPWVQLRARRVVRKVFRGSLCD